MAFPSRVPYAGIEMDAKTLTQTEITALPVGATIVVETADRKRAFRATKNDADDGSMFDMPNGGSISFIWRADGTLSHIMRWPVSMRAWPSTTTLAGVALAN